MYFLSEAASYTTFDVILPFVIFCLRTQPVRKLHHEEERPINVERLPSFSPGKKWCKSLSYAKKAKQSIHAQNALPPDFYVRNVSSTYVGREIVVTLWFRISQFGGSRNKISIVKKRRTCILYWCKTTSDPNYKSTHSIMQEGTRSSLATL